MLFLAVPKPHESYRTAREPSQGDPDLGFSLLINIQLLSVREATFIPPSPEL